MRHVQVRNHCVIFDDLERARIAWDCHLGRTLFWLVARLYQLTSPMFPRLHLKVSRNYHHFELDPTSEWLEKAEFHCRRALELQPDLPQAHVARAFLLWGPSKNFQHVEAIAELKRALALQNN